jgi:hypothetical protein
LLIKERGAARLRAKNRMQYSIIGGLTCNASLVYYKNSIQRVDKTASRPVVFSDVGGYGSLALAQKFTKLAFSENFYIYSVVITLLFCLAYFANHKGTAMGRVLSSHFSCTLGARPFVLYLLLLVDLCVICSPRLFC